jgi:hypothetical protein
MNLWYARFFIAGDDQHEKLLILSDPAEMNCIIRLAIREVGAIILLMLLLS